MGELTDKFWELTAEEGLELGAFLERLKKGEFGVYTTDEIHEFLLDVEQAMLSNIETKAQEGPPFAHMKEQVAEETREMIAEYISQYASE